MSWRFLGVLSLVLTNVAGCADERTAQISNFMSDVAFSRDKKVPLLHAVAVGDVSGGSSVLNTAGVTNAMFREALTATLKRNDLLADGSESKWRLDCVLDFDAPLLVVGDQNVTANIHYVLHEAETGSTSFDKLIQTDTSGKSGRSPGGDIAVFLLVGDTDGMGRRRTSYTLATRQNLAGFVAAL